MFFVERSIILCPYLGGSTIGGSTVQGSFAVNVSNLCIHSPVHFLSLSGLDSGGSPLHHF